MLALAEIEDRHNGSLLVLRWVALEDLGDELLILGVELERDVGVVVRGIAVLLSSSESWSCHLQVSILKRRNEKPTEEAN